MPADVKMTWLSLTVLLIAMTAPPAWCDQHMESKHVTRIQSVTSAVLSPDGNRVAYTVSVPRAPMQDTDGPAWSELHVAEIGAESSKRPFITGEVSIGTPQWSPDSKFLYYTAKRPGDSGKVLYRIPIDGGESVRVVTHANSIGGFDLSPDGQSVAFLATEEIAKEQQQVQEQGFDQEIYEEDSMPTRIWIADIDPPHAKPNLDRKSRMLELDGSALEVAWSPNGQDLMVVSAPTPSVDDSYMFARAHVVDSESGRVIRSLGNPGKLGQVAWSPDGRHLALISGEDIHDPHEGRLMVTSIDGEQPLKDLLPGLMGQVNSIAWLNDSTLIWLAAEGLHTRIGTVTLDGKTSDRIQPGETIFTSLSAATSNETIALIGNTASHPGELFVQADGQSELQRTTDTNPWLAEISLARQTPVEYEARDGVKIQGVLIYPLHYVEGRRYPTIMYVHGGPESHETNGWLTSYSRPGQVAAAKGFAVFYPNYRGSTGRGVEFSKMGQADAAGKEFDDLVDGVDHLIEMGLTAPESVGVTGGSYGGFASAWCSTYYSDRFAASVMFVGISDNLSKVGTTDIPEEMYLVHHRKRLWEDWDYFLERSPIRHIEKNQTPTLILHGKEDPRVHPSQSLEFFRHLKTLDQAPARLVLYEGEGHGNRKAAARLDYNLRMLRWMEQFLQKKGAEKPPIEINYAEAMGATDQN